MSVSSGQQWYFPIKKTWNNRQHEILCLHSLRVHHNIFFLKLSKGTYNKNIKVICKLSSEQISQSKESCCSTSPFPQLPILAQQSLQCARQVQLPLTRKEYLQLLQKTASETQFNYSHKGSLNSYQYASIHSAVFLESWTFSICDNVYF